MPEGVGYSSSNVTAGVGLELNYVGKRCFAYSGNVMVTTSATDLLNFTTGKESILGKVQFNPASSHDEDVIYRIYLNGLQIQTLWIFDNKVAGSSNRTHNYILMLIPPYTNVQITGTMTANQFNQNATFTGKLVE